MKKCAYCGHECADEAANCPSCSTETFVSTSPEALGHIISPEEKRFWERMTFREFAVFTIRLQALWFLFSAASYATYLPEYLGLGSNVTPHAWMTLIRVIMHIVMAVICIRYADRIVSWFVKDIVPKPVVKSDGDKPVV